MTQPSEFKKAFILHSRPYGETSLLIDFFTATNGRISTVAKGVRQIKSKRRALLQAFQPLLIDWTGNRELKTLTQVEVSHYFKPLWGDGLLSGIYINELIYRLLPHFDVHTQLFKHYENTLYALQSSAMPIEAALRLFEMQLLKELGYGLLLTHDAQTDEPINPQGNYFFESNVGLIAHRSALNKRCFLGNDLLKIARHELAGNDILVAAKRLMRLAIADMLSNHEIISRKLFV